MNSRRAQGKTFSFKSFSIITVALVVSVLASTNLSAHLSTEQKKSTTAARPDMAQAKKMYEQNCARCHGADGRGKTSLGELYGASDLTDGKRLARTSDRRLAAVIAQGKAGMPSFSKKLSPAEINALVKYVRTLKQ